MFFPCNWQELRFIFDLVNNSTENLDVKKQIVLYLLIVGHPERLDTFCRTFAIPKWMKKQAELYVAKDLEKEIVDSLDFAGSIETLSLENTESRIEALLKRGLYVTAFKLTLKEYKEGRTLALATFLMRLSYLSGQMAKQWNTLNNLSITAEDVEILENVARHVDNSQITKVIDNFLAEHSTSFRNEFCNFARQLRNPRLCKSDWTPRLNNIQIVPFLPATISKRSVSLHESPLPLLNKYSSPMPISKSKIVSLSPIKTLKFSSHQPKLPSRLAKEIQISNTSPSNSPYLSESCTASPDTAPKLTSQKAHTSALKKRSSTFQFKKKKLGEKSVVRRLKGLLSLSESPSDDKSLSRENITLSTSSTDSLISRNVTARRRKKSRTKGKKEGLSQEASQKVNLPSTEQSSTDSPPPPSPYDLRTSTLQQRTPSHSIERQSSRTRGRTPARQLFPVDSETSASKCRRTLSMPLRSDDLVEEILNVSFE